MADIKLKTSDGVEHTYTSISSMKVPGTDGAQVSFIVPTGNKNITDTFSVDVTNFATAQVVDSNLTSSNIIKDKIILGVTGAAEAIETVMAVPATKSTSVIYNSTNHSYYVWED